TSTHPENSLAAFRHAATLAIEEAECDVHLTRDGEVVVLHDASLDQTTLTTGPVRDLAASARRSAIVRGGTEQVPTLGGVLDIIRPSLLTLKIEIKLDAEDRPYPGMADAVRRLVEDRAMTARVDIISFDPASLRPCAAAGYRTGLCLETPPRGEA